MRLEFEQVFMMYLPRICEHCLNPSCVASCPSGAMYKREEDGIVLVDQEACRSWRFCVSGCPYKKVYFNWDTGKAEKCNLCYPRIEAGLPTVCSETCVGRLRHLGIVLIDTDRVEEAASVADEHDLLDAQLDLFLRPGGPRGPRAGAPRRDPRGLDRGGAALAGLRDVQALADRAAAAPRVPDAADGLVRAAALAGRGLGESDRRDGGDPPASSSRSRRCGSRSITSPASSPPATPSRSGARCAGWRRCAGTCAPRTSTAAPTRRSPARSGWSPSELEEMFRMVAIADYDDRYVVPLRHGEVSPAAFAEQGTCGIDFVGGGGACRRPSWSPTRTAAADFDTARAPAEVPGGPPATALVRTGTERGDGR